ncbi:MAG: acetoacetate--CoA ligase [Ilumatobacteraceae bacterium]
MPTPPVLWTPAADARTSTRLGRFLTFCEQRADRTFDGYDALWEWSVGDGLSDCWAAIWDWFGVDASEPYDTVLDRRVMPGARWFSGARLNYAQHAIRMGDGRTDEIALVGVSQSRDRIDVTWGDLTEQVARARCGLRRLGVGEGNHVAAYLPNVPETIVAFLAASSLGAIWTSCAPEFGVQAVLDRFRQVEPTVLLAVDRYRYGRREVNRVEELATIRAGLPTLTTTVVLPYPDADTVDGTITWDALLAEHEPLDFAQVAADHPLYVLYSSGTTGLPKPIIHGHAGVLVEHFKTLGLHGDMGPDDRFTWFTTTGWMMWNYVVSGLIVGSRVVLYDGDPNANGPGTLWKMAADERLTWFGGGAPFYTACMRAGLVPMDEFDLTDLRAIGSTGAPLPAAAFRWIYEAVAPDAMLSPFSGGTDVCTAFVGGSPMTPVWEGEIPTRYLGASIEAFDEEGHAVIGEQGELVLTQPMPTMPLGFVGDVDGSRLREAYFDVFPGVWRHGDWVVVTERGSCVISGRSDATLNRGGVRVGTAEIYRVAESIEAVADSLVVHLESSAADDPGTLVLFVVLDDGVDLDDRVRERIRSGLRTGLSPRHVPDEIYQMLAIPTTLSGKKLELPVKKILRGADPDEAASRGALKDPTALDAIVEIAARRSLR